MKKQKNEFNSVNNFNYKNLDLNQIPPPPIYQKIETPNTIKKIKDNKLLWVLVSIIIILLGAMIFLLLNEPKDINTSVEVNAKTGLPFIAVYKDVPIWLNPFFALAILLTIIVFVLSLYLWFRISLRNRTNVIIHMPDSKRKFISYKKFSGTIFKIKGYEKDKDNNPIYYNYRFRPECLESGYFGSYIEFDYGILEPLNPRKRDNMSQKNLPEIFKFISSLLNTQLAVDLLLSQKFKEFVKMMLTILVIMIFIVILINGYMVYVQQQQNTVFCVLANSTQNYEMIRGALR